MNSVTKPDLGPKGSTPAILLLEKEGIFFQVASFSHEVAVGDHGYGKAAAIALGVAEERVFKTLLVALHGGPSTHGVGIVPVSGLLSLKAMASALGAKKAEMLEPNAAERMTGYVVGGISPFAQRRKLLTVIDQTALRYDSIFVSAGKRGLDIEINGHDLVRVLSATVADISQSSP